VNRRRFPTQTRAGRRVALIGVAAILFQAFLFGWHHHAVALPQSSGPLASVYSATQPPEPATAEELCEICTVLHQQSAAPLAFITPPKPSAITAPADLPASVFYDQARTRGFDARAPPRPETTPAH
jgi:hypothetical protein